MREDDALGVLVELNHLEVELLVELCARAVSLDEVLGSGKALYAVGECDHGTLLYHLDDGALVYRANGEDGLEYIPRILLELLVAKREATLLLVYLEHLNVDVGTNLSELAGVLNLLGPREVGDVDEAVYALLDLDEVIENYPEKNSSVVIR